MADQELRREVEWMLEHRAQAADFIQAPAMDILAMSVANDKRASLATSPFGPYRDLMLIASGGMGEVYRARDTRLDRTVAIKFLSPGNIGATARERFQREARLASSLNHPHI